MYVGYNKQHIDKARELRNHMTKEERKIWYDFLKTHKCRFLRQKIIDNYIVDFYCPKAKLIIELDGNQHYTKDGIEYDNIRTEILQYYKLAVIRLKNEEINSNFSDSCRRINLELKKRLLYLRELSPKVTEGSVEGSKK